VAQSNVELRINSSQAVRALKVVDGQAKKFNSTIQKSGGTLKNTSKGLFGFGLGSKAAGAGAAAATPAVAGLGVAINSALAPLALVTAGMALFTKTAMAMAEQDKANASLRTLGVDSVALEGKLKGLSSELKNQFSVTELTVAAYDVASAGFTDAADAAMVLKASAQAASAGMADIATTGDAVTTVLNAWKLSGEDATMVADKMQQTVADGKIKISEYASNIGKVATVASMVGVPLDEVNAAIALSTKNGVKAEVAFTGMKTALLRLAGEAGGKKLEKLGIDISAATIQSEGLAANLEKLQGLDIKSLEQIFGQEAIQTMGPVLANLKEYNAMLEKQESSAGVAAEAAGEMTQTMGGAWAELTKGMGNVLTLGEGTRELLTSVIQGATVGLKIISQLLTPVAKNLARIVAFINNIIRGIKDIADSTPEWIKKLLGVSNAKAEEETPASKAAKDVKAIAENAKGAANNIVETNNKLKETPVITEKITEETDKLKEQWKSVGETIKSDVTNSIKGAIKGSQTLGQSMGNILSSIADKAMDVALNMALWGAGGKGGLLGGIFSGFGFADGGRPPVGKASIVGEKGPELFVPNSSGTIISNDQIGRGGSTVNVTVNATESNVSASGGEAKQLGLAIASAVQQQLVKERRPGGLLT
jgi:TP901 family phage tail tape measure protein